MIENVENQQSIGFLKQGEIADFQRRKSSSSNFTKTIFARLAKKTGVFAIRKVKLYSLLHSFIDNYKIVQFLSIYANNIKNVYLCKVISLDFV